MKTSIVEVGELWSVLSARGPRCRRLINSQGGLAKEPGGDGARGRRGEEAYVIIQEVFTTGAKS